MYSEYQAGYSNWIAATGEIPVIDAARTDCTLDNPGSIEALNFLKGLYDAGYMPSVSTMGGASADDAFNFWASQKVAMVTAGAWKLPQALSEVTFNWDIVQLPKHPETGRSRSNVHAVGYVASASTPSPDLAANLILFLASDAGQRFFAEGGSVAPGNPSPELQQLWIDSFGETGVNVQAYVDATVDSYGVTLFDEIWNAMNAELVVQIFDLDMDIEDAVAAACEVIDPYLVAPIAGARPDTPGPRLMIVSPALHPWTGLLYRPARSVSSANRWYTRRQWLDLVLDSLRNVIMTTSILNWLGP